MHSSLIRRSFVMALLLILGGSAGSKAFIHTASFTLPFELVDNRVFINVRLNGHGPYQFILDTGATGTISDHVARELGLRVRGGGQGQGVGQKQVKVGRTRLAQVQIGNLRLSNVEFQVISFADTAQIFGAKPVDGVIGRPVFEQMVVRHDYVHHRLTFTDPVDFAHAGRGIEVDFRRPYNIPVVQASVDGIPGQFGVDTGARSSLLLYVDFWKRNRLQVKYGAHVEGVTGWGIGGPVRSLLARARRISIGALQVRDPVIRLSTQTAGLTASSEMAGLIGPDVLSQFDVTFDYSRNHIFFEKNSQYGRRDSYDRAGLWMGQDGRHFTVVDVVAGGPAQKAGVREGDTILAIDGVDTGQLVLPDIRQTMRRRPAGSRVALRLESKGKLYTAIIILRDLV